MAPPSSCTAITLWADWAHHSGASRLRFTMASTKRGDASAASTCGEPPALLISTSSRPKCSTALAMTRSASGGLRMSAVTKTAPSTSASLRPHATTCAPAAADAAPHPPPPPPARWPPPRHDGPPGGGDPRRNPGPAPTGAARHDHDTLAEVVDGL